MLMYYLKNSLIVCSLLCLMGCSTTPKIEYITKYKEVYIPVRQFIEIPDKPKFLKSDTELSYLSKVLQHTSELRLIIINNNKGLNNETNK